ncbi:MAG: hypothetical protein R2867_43990 [Caldilineaceae bacterium]
MGTADWTSVIVFGGMFIYFLSLHSCIVYLFHKGEVLWRTVTRIQRVALTFCTPRHDSEEWHQADHLFRIDGERRGVLDAVPKGYEVSESKNGLPSSPQGCKHKEEVRAIPSPMHKAKKAEIHSCDLRFLLWALVGQVRAYHEILVKS